MSHPEKTTTVQPVQFRRADLFAGAAAVSGGVLSVFAWAACCVLPLAMSLAGVSFAGAAMIAGLRGPMTIAAVIALAVGWVVIWQRRRRCETDATCPRPSSFAFWLMLLATLLVAAAMAWEPIIEPWAMVRLGAIQ